MQAITDNLIHFLGREHRDSPRKQLEIFESIIRLGLRCGKIQIKFDQGGAIHNQVVCFSDIPLSMCDEHAATYGKFGIGFKKSFIKKCGGNPARYFINYLPGEMRDDSRFESRGLLYASLCIQFNVLLRISRAIESDPSFALYDKNGDVYFKPDGLKTWVAQQLSIFSFEKETGELGPARDETREIDLYYKEREWRLVPFQAAVDSGIVKFSDNDGLGYYKFCRNDVNMIVTPNDDLRTKVLRFLLSLEKETDDRLRNFANNPIPVVSYDDLKKW